MADRRPERVRHVEHAMGTVFSFDVSFDVPGGARGDGAARTRDAVTAAVASLHEADAVFSTYRPDSPLSRLARGELTVADCPPQVAEVLDRCAEEERRTDGWFSAGHAGGLDPTGLVKGWAVERAARIILAGGARGVCVGGGGDLQMLGEPEPGGYWRLGIADPLRPGRLATVINGAGELAVATSGTAERGRHIVDPRTGRPAAGMSASVTVVAPSLTRADAWATAAFAMGERAQRWVEGLAGAEAFAVLADGSTWRTGGFGRLVGAAAA